jgi:hypothetical protein
LIEIFGGVEVIGLVVRLPKLNLFFFADEIVRKIENILNSTTSDSWREYQAKMRDKRSKKS